ncbi:hypothetical protein [Actinoplanes sp. NPDC051859]|uniref:hypothetical protein n=1 Tax=Actinoplanes sp. NPDC051859 TaxID=3363909 RepID=UPI0037A1A45F
MKISRTVLGSALLAAATVITWYAWLGHDTTYQLDPATGVESGPYTAIQVIGCVVTLVALLVAAVLAGVNRWAAPAVLTVAFTVPWTFRAMQMDDSGMFAIGAGMLVIGLGSGAVVVAAITDYFRNRGSRRSGGTVPVAPTP